jgi:hypothetical protein
MKQNKKDLDAIIENTSRSIRDEQIDATMMNESATRVWALLSQQAAENSAVLTSNMESLNKMNLNNDQISGCADFQSLIPAYLDGKLSAARTLLLEDHSNECIPCRNELKVQRDAAQPASVAAQPSRITFGERASGYTRGWKLNNFARLGIAAAAVVVLGLVGLFMYERLDLSGTTLAATLETSEGLVFVVSDPLNVRPLNTGEQIQKGEHIRTGKDSNAVLKLADGSTVEMSERSEFYVTQNMRGVTIRLDRGDVIVEAAKQHNGRLYVQTPDSLVSVKGTIFAVESGTKGSRVSVVEGEVKVDQAGKEETLLPGDQTTSNANIDRTPVSQSVAWSRNASKYANLVSDLAKVRNEVNQKVARPGVRYSSKFINLLPENTVFFAALPNISESLAQSQQIMQERIKQNPALAEWKKKDHEGFMVDEKTMARIREFGSQLGDEIVVTARLDAKNEPSGILVLGDVKNAANFRNFVNEQIANFAKQSGDMPNVRLIDDPMNVAPAKTVAVVKSKTADKAPPAKSELYIWINNDTFAASPQIETLRGFATSLKSPEANRFVNTPFYQRINDVYKNGAGLVIAADLEKIVAQNIGKSDKPEDQRKVEGLKQLGITNLRHFVAEQKEVGGRTLSQAALTFSEADKGIASWLAAPGPMGALDFISANANVVAAFVVKDPALLADDLLNFLGTVDPEMLSQMEGMAKSQGFDIRNDFAAPLGGEFAFAIDGPILPTPSWKMVLEVYDQAKLQDTLERSIEKLNQFSMLHGKGKISLETAVSGDRTYYTVKSEKGLEVNYIFTNGYLVAAPTRALLEQSLRNRDAGNTLVTSARFRSSLPQDGNANFSAIFYHDLAPLMQTLAEKMKTAGGTEQDRQKLAMFDASAPPTLAYAYAQGDRITFAANTEGGAFGLNPASLIGMPNSFQMQHILMNAMGDKDVQKKSE